MELQHIIYFLILFLLIHFWWQTQKAREKAEKIAKKICEQENMQMLDGTVAFARLEFKPKSRWEFRLIRQFKFEFSATGAERRSGLIAMHNMRQEYVYMDLPQKPTIELDEHNIH